VTEPAAPVAWDELLRGLRDAGSTVGGLIGTVPDVDVAEGYRYVLDLLADQLGRSALRASDHPLFLPGVTPVRKLFFDNPDTDYDTAFIRGDRTYRIRGHRGTPTYLAFCAYAGNPARGEPTRVSNLADTDIAFELDGSFEITLSTDRRPGTWLALPAGAHTLIARQYFLDRAAETPARYVIDAVGNARPGPPRGLDRLARLARDSARFVTASTTLAHQRAERAQGSPNRFVEVPGHGVYGTPDAGYVACWYRLGPDEALVIDVEPPPCRYWGVHLANRWGQSLDHRTRPTCLNAHSAALRPDGTVGVVVAADDEGPNWLDTAGHDQGWVLFRWLLGDRIVVPDARVVNRADVAQEARWQPSTDATSSSGGSPSQPASPPAVS